MPSVLESVVQAAGPSLPELDHVRHDSDAAPEVWHGNLVVALEALLDLFDLLLQLFPAAQHAALLTRPGAQSTASDACVVVDLTLLTGHALHRALDSDLTFQFMPPKGQASVRIALDISSLPARTPVAVDDPTPVVQLFQIDHSRAHSPGRQFGSTQGDGFGLMDLFGCGVLEPNVELGQGIGVELCCVQAALCVLLGLLRVVCAAGGEDALVGCCHVVAGCAVVKSHARSKWTWYDTGWTCEDAVEAWHVIITTSRCITSTCSRR
jgi:hypothetical protein